jgi:high-affinity iron transporter
MLTTFLIMFREGVEAALIVGIIASYLKQTGRTYLMKAVWIGIILATLLCLTLAIILQATSGDFPQQEQELFAGVIAIVAVVMLTWMVFWMRRAARSIKGELHSQIEAAIAQGDRWGLALVGMSFFAVLREGLETVVFLIASFQQNLGFTVPLGAVLGYLAAIAVGFGIYQGGVRLNLKRFFKWTGAFIILVAAGLLAGSVRAFHEAGIWNLLQATVFDASDALSSQGVVGSVLAGMFGYNDTPTVSETIAYWGYLIPTLVLFFSGSKSTRRVPSTHIR